MNSIKFPNMFNMTTTNIVSDYDATYQNLRLLLASDKGELFGDPYFGSGVKKYLFDQNDSVLRDVLIDDIYTSILLFMPQITVNRTDIKINNNETNVSVTLKALNKADFTTDLYEIVLLQSSVK